MRILVQRVLSSSVTVEDKIVGKIENGFTIFVGFKEEDTKEVLDKMILKLVNLRIFDDEDGVMNLSILDKGYSILSISQFTLYADTKKGNRPSYKEAKESSSAKELYDLFNQKLSEYIKVEQGVFGADMKVSIVNDGPVTILLESR